MLYVAVIGLIITIIGMIAGFIYFIGHSLTKWHRRFDRLDHSINTSLSEASEMFFRGDLAEPLKKCEEVLTSANPDLIILTEEQRRVLDRGYTNILMAIKNNDQEKCQKEIVDILAGWQVFHRRPTANIFKCWPEFLKTMFSK